MRIKLALATVAALGAAGCGPAPASVDTPSTTTPAKTTSPTPSSLVDPNSIKAVAVVAGDFVDFDMCSLVDHPTLSIGGMVRPALGRSYDQCDVHIDAAAPAFVVIGPWHHPTPGNSRPGVTGLPGGLTDNRVDADPGECAHRITFTDGIELDILVTPEANKPIAACDIAATVVTSVSARARDGKGARFPSPDPKSLRGVDACQVVPAGVVTGAGKPVGLSSHMCDWRDTDLDVRLAFTEGMASIYGTEKLGKPETIAGRASFVNDSPNNNPPGVMCEVALEHNRAKGPQSSMPNNEYAVVSVETTGPDRADLCTVARKIAASVWPKLPAA
ncbi:hypothetical protein [Alloactinosynnema sp. L-07]|uniref:hypothetical protein n=1 Tax=Alloactinosynnema sp. L-07 TaxID=1653480 RepID=UPI00065F0115|nr:hypothetical protein [Alloactinosynnema sp. L-07]CRK55846.1 hypothetical protein [Alloactinosynnema sp. L-07]